MNINRIWAMPNKETFQILPIKELLKRYIKPGGEGWFDFFARESKIAELRNDINPKFNTHYTCDALDLSKKFVADGRKFKGVISDYPYSMNQNKVCYNDFGKGHYCVKPTSMKYWSEYKNNVAKIISKDGISITFGWSSMGLGKNRGFEIVEILLVPHGGSRNDTIVTVEKKL